MVLHGVKSDVAVVVCCGGSDGLGLSYLWFGLDFWLFRSDVENPWDTVAL